MEQTSNNTQTMRSDEKDLRELWQILVKRKIMIFTLTLVITLGAFLYTLTVQPVYNGSVTLEVGQVADEEFSEGKFSSLAIRELDNVNNLKHIVSTKFDVSASVIKNTTLLTYSATNTSRDAIKTELTNAVAFTLERHKEKAKLYSGLHSKVNMTQLTREVTVGDRAIKPKKKLIIVVSFITGLMLSIFLAFFLEFIQGFKKPENEE